MRIVAVLLPGANQPDITDLAWESLIQARGQPANSGVRRGINPFTKKPLELPPKPNRVLKIVEEGKQIGSIEWAQDGSNMLLVRQEEKGETYRNALIEAARDVARCLGVTCDIEDDMVRFSRDDDYVAPPEEPLEKALRLWKAGDGEGAVAHYMVSFNVDLRVAVRELKDLAARGTRSDS
jgi:hypothetical protein